MDVHGHLDDRDIESYSLNNAADPELAQWEEHLLVCPACRAQVEAGDAYVRAMREAARLEQARESKRPKWSGVPRFALLLAAALVLAAIFLRPTPKAEPFAVALFANRGGAVRAQAPEGVPLALQPDLEGLPSAVQYRMQVVDEWGKQIWKGAFPGSVVKPQASGVYFVRLYGQSGELLREYGLEVSPRH